MKENMEHEHERFFKYVNKRIISFSHSSPVTNKVMGGRFVDSIVLREDHSFLYFNELLECLESYKKRKLVASFLTDIFLYCEYIIGIDEYRDWSWNSRFMKTKSRIDDYLKVYSHNHYS